MKNFSDIKLISCDLDGTILNFKGKPSKKCEVAIKKLHKKGIILIANSGRPIFNIPLEIINLPFDYIVCLNGQYIKNTKTKKVILKADLNKNELILLHNLAIKNFCFSSIDYQSHTYIITNKVQFVFAFMFDILNRIRFVFKQRVKNKVHFLTDINSFDIKKTGKICFISTHKNLIKLKQAIESLPNSPYHGFFVAKNWLEVQHKNISKGEALKEIASNLNIKKEQIMAFGDGENDIPMLENAGIKICMSNGMKKTQQIADYIAPSFLEDGFATFINENLL